MKKHLYILILLIGLNGIAFADSKVTALSANTTPISTDIMYLVDDPGGTPASQKITLESLFDTEDVIGKKSFEDEDWGDMSVSSNSVTLDADVPLKGSPTVATSIDPDTADGATIGSATKEWSDLFLAAGGVIYGENDQSNTLTSSVTGWTANLNFSVIDDAYDSGWNTDTGSPQKDDIYDYFHQIDTDDDGDIGDENFNVSGAWEWQDGIHLSFGNDDDASWAWDSADARLELRDVSDVPIFWFDLANHSFNVKAVASPQNSLYDSDAAGSARADEYAGGIGANFTTTTEDAEVSDVNIYYQKAGTKTSAIEVDGSAGGVVRHYDEIQMIVFGFTTDTATGDGKFYFHIGQKLGGLNLGYCHAEVITAGTTNTLDIQIYNLTQTADMLSTKITVDTAETGSDTAATPYVIDTGNDDVAENDVIRVDVDAVHTTAAKGLILTLGFNMP